MKKILLLALAALTSISSFAQYEAKMKEQNVIKGAVIINGEKQEGYIKQVRTVDVNGDQVPAFYLLHEEFEFIDKVTFETIEKIKGKHRVKYSPKDCDGFYYGDYHFETRKFVSDPTAIGTAAIPKKTFLRVLKQYEKVTFYAYYFSTLENTSIEGSFRVLDPEKVANNISNPCIAYYLEGADRVKWVESLNAKKEFPDCPAILEKVENKMYKYDRTAEDNFQLFGISIATNSATFSIGDQNRNLNILDDFVNGKCE